jgi:hypothetical protein
MSVQRVVARSAAAAPELWVTTTDKCFYCGDGFTEHELAVTWMANSDSGKSCWHLGCSASWGAAFMRDVWEAGHADRHPDSVSPGKFDEPAEWTAP